MGISLRELRAKAEQEAQASSVFTQKPDASDTSRQLGTVADIPTRPDTTRLPSLSELRQQTEKPEGPSPLTSFGNKVHNLWKLYNISVGSGTPDDYAEIGKIAAATEGTMPGALQKVGRDIINTLAYYGKKQPKPGEPASPSLMESLKGITAESLVAGVPNAFLSILTSPIESITGVGMDQDTLYAMTPEQRAQAIKDSAANIAMFAAGGAVGSAMKEAAIAKGARAIAATEGVAEAVRASQQAAIGGVARAMLRGTAEAAAGGAAYSAVSRMGEPDALNQILINGVLFAPIGAAFERIKMFGKSTDEVGQTLAKQASDLAQTRQLQITTQDSYADVLYKLDGLQHANNIAEAVVNGKLRAAPDNPLVVPGVTADVFPSVISTIAKGDTKVVPQFYKRPDGLYDMLVTPENKLTNTQTRSFRDTGLIPGQLVSINGNDYRFRSLSRDGTNVNVVNMQTGRTYSKPRESVRARTDVEIHDVTPENIIDPIWQDFRSFMLADAEGKPAPTPTAPQVPFSQPRVDIPQTPNLISRIKSGIGRFFRDETGTLRMTDTDQEALYSRIDNALFAPPFAKGTGQQWKAYLAKGSPQFERDWTGMDKWLEDNKDKVLTKGDVWDKWNENQIGITEVVYGGKEYRAARERANVAAEAVSQYMWDLANKYDTYHGDLTKVTPEEKNQYYELKKAADEANYAAKQTKRPKFESYTEQGGENYRAILLTLDRKTGALSSEAASPEHDIFNQATNDFINEGHWPEKNVLVWARVKDYTLPNGQKALYVDEIQSDWAQKMRKEGVRLPIDLQEIERLKSIVEEKEGIVNQLYDKTEKLNEEYTKVTDKAYSKEVVYNSEEYKSLLARASEINKELDAAYAEIQTHNTARWEASDRIQELRGQQDKGVPDMPFKKTQDWQLLMMKRLIAEAAHGGYDRIVMTTGERQFMRWGSEYIQWKQNEDGSFTVRGANQVSPTTNLANEVGRENIVSNPEELGDALGNILYNPDEETVARIWKKMQTNPTGETFPRKEGMDAFYGPILENTMKDYAKKLGVKIDFEDTTIPEINNERFKESEYYNALLDATEQGHTLTPEQVAELRKSFIVPEKPVRSFAVPEQLKQIVKSKGQPLGRTNVAALASITAGGIGGLYGLTQGATPQERERNSLLYGAGAALLLGAGLSKRGQEFLKSEKGSFEIPDWMKEGEEPIASGPPDKPLMNQEPRSTFQDMLDSFGDDRGFSKNERSVLEREFVERMFKEAYKNLPANEQSVISSLNNEIENTILHPGGSRLEQAQIAAKIASEDVVRKAHSNGMFVDEEAGGNLVLRDAASARIVGRFKNTREAVEFIDKSGQAGGVALDGGGFLPPLGSGLMPIDDGPPPAGDNPYAVRPNGKIGALTDLVNTVFDWATPNRNIITSLDSAYRTKFFARIYDPLQVARMHANAAIRPWYEKLKTLDALAVKMSMAEREQVGHFLETMSPEEVKARGGTGGRPLNPDEVRLGEYFASKNIDLSRVQQFNRELNRLADELDKGRMSQTAHDTLKQAAIDGFAMDDAHLEAARIVQGIKTGKSAFMGAVTRYANSIMNKDVSRADFATANNMSGNQIRLAYGLEDLYNNLARTFNIPEEYRLQNFMTHARLYTEGNISGALRDFDMPPAVKDFYAALARTGEISSYEKDPVRATQRYIKAGFDSRLMAPAIEQARKALPEELLKLPDEVRGKAETVVKRYMNDVQGIPGEASKFTQVGVNNFLNKLGLNIPVNVRQDLVNLVLATGEAAMQGFRIIAGIRDLTQGVGWYYARFGLDRTARMLEYGTKGLDGVTKADLQAGGLVPELNVLFFATPTEFTGTTLGRASNVVGRTIRNVSQVGLKLSGQKDVYAMLHAGSYLDTWKLAGEELQKLMRGETTKQVAYDKLKLQTYEVPAILEFDKLVDANRIDDAARLLARETGREQVGVFGSGNNPGGWNRNIGRIAGQYGSWSMWYRAQLMRMASRGTVGQRSAAMLRLAATQAALAGTSVALGVSLKNWYAPAGAIFTGGPLVDAFQTVGDAVQGRGYVQEAALNRLKRYLPYDPWSDEFNIGQPYIPGSYFLNDLAKAYEMAQQNDPLAIPRAFGVKPAQ